MTTLACRLITLYYYVYVLETRQAVDKNIKRSNLKKIWRHKRSFVLTTSFGVRGTPNATFCAVSLCKTQLCINYIHDFNKTRYVYYKIIILYNNYMITFHYIHPILHEECGYIRNKQLF